MSGFVDIAVTIVAIALCGAIVAYLRRDLARSGEALRRAKEAWRRVQDLTPPR